MYLISKNNKLFLFSVNKQQYLKKIRVYISVYEII
jgi:hypothetical protein